MMNRQIRRLYARLATLLVVFGATACLAQDFPSKPIHMVVPYPPGTQIDLPVRLIADAVQARLGQPMVIDNRPGAAGIIGHDYVARQPADGYSLIFSGAL